MPYRRLGLTILASLALAIPGLAAAQHVPRARRVGTVVVGDARLELLAYDDGTVTAGTSATMTSAMARWRGDELGLRDGRPGSAAARGMEARLDEDRRYRHREWRPRARRQQARQRANRHDGGWQDIGRRVER